MCNGRPYKHNVINKTDAHVCGEHNATAKHPEDSGLCKGALHDEHTSREQHHNLHVCQPRNSLRLVQWHHLMALQLLINNQWHHIRALVFGHHGCPCITTSHCLWTPIPLGRSGCGSSSMACQQEQATSFNRRASGGGDNGYARNSDLQWFKLVCPERKVIALRRTVGNVACADVVAAATGALCISLHNNAMMQPHTCCCAMFIDLYSHHMSPPLSYLRA